jgi:hypothetical protein
VLQCCCWSFVALPGAVDWTVTLDLVDLGVVDVQIVAVHLQNIASLTQPPAAVQAWQIVRGSRLSHTIRQGGAQALQAGKTEKTISFCV